MFAANWWAWDGFSTTVPALGLVSRRYAISGPQLAYSLVGNALRYDPSGPQTSPYQIIGPDTKEDNFSQQFQPHELQ